MGCWPLEHQPPSLREREAESQPVAISCSRGRGTAVWGLPQQAAERPRGRLCLGGDPHGRAGAAIALRSPNPGSCQPISRRPAVRPCSRSVATPECSGMLPPAQVHVRHDRTGIPGAASTGDSPPVSLLREGEAQPAHGRFGPNRDFRLRAGLGTAGCLGVEIPLPSSPPGLRDLLNRAGRAGRADLAASTCPRRVVDRSRVIPRYSCRKSACNSQVSETGRGLTIPQLSVAEEYLSPTPTC
jgi:hypothetical protein